MLSFLNEGNIKKIEDLKEKIDKYFTIVIGCLMVLSTLWDVIRFHCYWADYMLEFYSCFFMIFMVLYFVMPAKIPKIITDYFGLIKLTLGRAIIMLVFSLLFLGDKHLFHQLCSIFLFIGGTVILILELITLPKKDEHNKFYETNKVSEPNEISNQSDSNPPTKLDDSQPGPEVLDSNPNDNKPPSSLVD